MISFLLKAQELPPIILYDSKEYGAENQNWAISQADNKYIYVANNKGLLEFNGAKWQLYPSPNESIIRSVHVVDDRIYTGAYMDFGYWQQNNKGILSYTSLSQKLKLNLIEDEQFWNIVSLEDFVLFQSLDRIYLYDLKTHSCKIVDSEHTITKMFKVNGNIYYQNLEEGVFEIENGVSKTICEDPIVKRNILVNVFKMDNGLLMQTQEKGFYLWKNGNLSPWQHPAQDLVSELSVYSSIQLENGNLILGTISNGMVYLNQNGDFLYKINQTKGLGNNTVLSLFEDLDNNIWLGLDNGINSINMKSPFSIYNDEEGKLGTVYASIVHNGKLYLGTNQGLFSKDVKGNGQDFEFIEGTKGQVWCLVEQDAKLFCGHNVGTFLIDGNTAELIVNVPGTWSIKPYFDNRDILLQGNYNGINVLHKISGKWQLRNKLEGFNISSKYFELYDRNTIFVSHEYKGVFQLKVNDGLTDVVGFEKDSLQEKGFNSGLVTYNGQMVYTYERGIFVYDNNKKIFLKDSILSSIFHPDHYTSGKLIPDPIHNKLWAFSDKNLIYVSPGKLSNTPEITLIPFPQSLRKEMVGYETICNVEGNEYLLGTSTGYVLIDLDKLYDKSYEISITKIANHTIDGHSVWMDRTVASQFKNNQNNIEFTYSVAEFDKYLEAEYQYQLKGYYDQWSKWSSTPSVLFKNLPHGDYEFNVRARVGNTLTSSTSFIFNIEKPWYISNVMIALYIFAVALFSLLMHNLYRNYYKKQKEKLLLKNKQELELKQLESEQQLMQVKNEKLQQDIDNKNRELAISTMSLIKKNEFLNTVKEELKNADDSSALKPVIKFIDKNLNNTDDWKFFQEAFNNADKDFLKKIKSKHPALTPNDLKLCAYLRLNLSSKEIAPLLNISPKSVEVKRYRLRKKMDLPHDYSLTNYILEI